MLVLASTTPSPTPYTAMPATNTPNAGAVASTGTATTISARPIAEQRAVAALGQLLGEHRADSGEQHHHQQQARQPELGEVPLVPEIGEPGGQADEDEALGREARGDGHAGPVRSHGGIVARRTRSALCRLRM